MAIPPHIPGLTDWRPLARGGFAIVWQARQETLNRLVAVKVDQRTLEVEAEQRRFLREAGAAGRMSGHPGIVTVHDAGILTDDRPYLVMELCPGGSLTRWLKPENRPTPQRVRDVGVRIADALAAAHSRGVLHRDVKPANILIDAYDNAGLADFGLAALPDPGMELSQTLEALTPAYAPPEAFEQLPPTEYGDVYSLGGTLYALLKGQPPRWAEGVKPSVGAALEQLKTPVEPIAGVDPELMSVLLSCMADEPTARPTAAELRDRLAALSLPDASAAGEPDADRESAATAARPVPGERIDDPTGGRTDGRTSGRPGRGRGFLAAALIAAVLILAAVVIASVVRPGANVAGEPPVNGTPTPTAAGSTSASATSSPTASPATNIEMPAGFSDCSDELGPNTYCVVDPECWYALSSLYDSPYQATAPACDEVHVYQTFAAGQLSALPRRQSDVDKDPQVRKVCTPKVANSMLAEKDRRKDWEVYGLPPQEKDPDLLFRCIVGRGERDTPLRFRKP